MALYTGWLRPKRGLFQASGTLYPRYTDTRLIYNVHNGNFRLSQRKNFFAKINLLNTDTS